MHRGEDLPGDVLGLDEPRGGGDRFERRGCGAVRARWRHAAGRDPRWRGQDVRGRWAGAPRSRSVNLTMRVPATNTSALEPSPLHCTQPSAENQRIRPSCWSAVPGSGSTANIVMHVRWLQHGKYSPISCEIRTADSCAISPIRNELWSSPKSIMLMDRSNHRD